jgi:hypothetical protein
VLGVPLIMVPDTWVVSRLLLRKDRFVERPPDKIVQP